MENQNVPGFRLSRRQFFQSALALGGGASVFSTPALRWLMPTSAPPGYLAVPQARSAAGVLFLTGMTDGQAQVAADRLAQEGTLALVANANNRVEAWAAVSQLLAHPQFGAATIGVIGVGVGLTWALRLAYSHRAVGAVALIGTLPDNTDWQSDFARLQDHGAKTLILTGDVSESAWTSAARFAKQSAV